MVLLAKMVISVAMVLQAIRATRVPVATRVFPGLLEVKETLALLVSVAAMVSTVARVPLEIKARRVQVATKVRWAPQAPKVNVALRVILVWLAHLVSWERVVPRVPKVIQAKMVS